MPKRNFFQYLLISLKGLAMGAADVVPGVSGGTIAFISGIYEELIETIHKLDFGFFKIWKKEGFKNAWRTYNLSFLVALGLGIFVSIVSLAKVILWLLETYPIAVWSFFFGLVVASIIYILLEITRWRPAYFVVLVLATFFSYYITIVEPLGTADSNWFLFFAGFIAIIAMILPGISGAFVLLLLGAYANVMQIVSNLTDGVLSLDLRLLTDAVLKMLVFALGAATGLKVFSKALNWMFNHHKNLTLALLTGFMIGALNKIWPWKEVLEYRVDSSGKEVPFLEKSILPNQFSGEPYVMYAILFAGIGFFILFFLERLASQKK